MRVSSVETRAYTAAAGHARARASRVRRADDGAHVEDLRIALAAREVALGSAVVERDSRLFELEDGATKLAEALVERDSNQGTSGRNRGTRAVKPTARDCGASERRENRGKIG